MADSAPAIIRIKNEMTKPNPLLLKNVVTNKTPIMDKNCSSRLINNLIKLFLLLYKPINAIKNKLKKINKRKEVKCI